MESSLEGWPLGANLLDVIRRGAAPAPWTEGEKIPWGDAGFSRRMLKEHLSQAHDAASRRTQRIETHVEWIHREALAGAPNRVLDLGCGPGLYTSRLALLGHECAGIDFSPASIAYAEQDAVSRGLSCTYELGDVREVDYGTGVGLVMLIFGELNTFRREDARRILDKARLALAKDGVLLLEAHTCAAVRDRGEHPATWYSAECGLFSDRPHLCLRESFWHSGLDAATERYFVVDSETGEVTRHAASMQAYTTQEYEGWLRECGFDRVKFHPSMGQPQEVCGSEFVVMTARRPD